MRLVVEETKIVSGAELKVTETYQDNRSRRLFAWAASLVSITTVMADCLL